MRKRNVQILFRLNRKEAESFDKIVKRSGLSREVYLRHLVQGLIPTDAPAPDYYSMMRYKCILKKGHKGSYKNGHMLS